MKKKIKDITLEEHEKICSIYAYKMGDGSQCCLCCPFYSMQYDLCKISKKWENIFGSNEGEVEINL